MDEINREIGLAALLYGGVGVGSHSHSDHEKEKTEHVV